MDAEIETLFLEIEISILKTLNNIPCPEGVIYACGFWLFYCDYTMLGVPCFAYNTAGNEKDSKWCPPEWIVDVEGQMAVTLNPLYQQVSSYMKGKNDEEWETLIEYHWDIYSEFCLSLNQSSEIDEHPLAHWNLSDDFVIGIFEEREGEEIYDFLAKASVGEKKAIELGIV